MIIRKHPFAYDLGIIHCIVGFVFFGLLIISNVGLVNSQATSMMIQILFFGGLITYFMRHRSEWKNG